MRANERTDERVAQYLRLDSCLFQTTVDCPSVWSGTFLLTYSPAYSLALNYFPYFRNWRSLSKRIPRTSRLVAFLVVLLVVILKRKLTQIHKHSHKLSDIQALTNRHTRTLNTSRSSLDFGAEKKLRAAGAASETR